MQRYEVLRLLARGGEGSVELVRRVSSAASGQAAASSSASSRASGAVSQQNQHQHQHHPQHASSSSSDGSPPVTTTAASAPALLADVRGRRDSAGHSTPSRSGSAADAAELLASSSSAGTGSSPSSSSKRPGFGGKSAKDFVSAALQRYKSSSNDKIERKAPKDKDKDKDASPSSSKKSHVDSVATKLLRSSGSQEVRPSKSQEMAAALAAVAPLPSNQKSSEDLRGGGDDSSASQGESNSGVESASDDETPEESNGWLDQLKKDEPMDRARPIDAIRRTNSTKKLSLVDFMREPATKDVEHDPFVRELVKRSQTVKRLDSLVKKLAPAPLPPIGEDQEELETISEGEEDGPTAKPLPPSRLVVLPLTSSGDLEKPSSPNSASLSASPGSLRMKPALPPKRAITTDLFTSAVELPGTRQPSKGKDKTDTASRAALTESNSEEAVSPAPARLASVSGEYDSSPVAAGAVSPRVAETLFSDTPVGNLFVLKRKYCDSMEGANASLQEAITMVRCASDRVVSFEDVFLEPHEMDGFKFYYLCIVMEYCEGGDLAQWVVSHPLDAVVDAAHDTEVRMRAARQLLLGLSDVHAANLAHRDIKPENVFIRLSDLDGSVVNESFVLGDFGIASKKLLTKFDETAGTHTYMAPEIVDGRSYDAKCDIFSLGACMMELATGQLLSSTKKGRDAAWSLIVSQSSDWTPSFLKRVPERLRHLAEIAIKCLCASPENRPTAATLLQEPIFKGPSHAHTMDSALFGQSLLDDDLNGAIMRRPLTPLESFLASSILASSFEEDARWPSVAAGQLHLGREVVFPVIVDFFLRYGAVWGLFTGRSLQAVALWIPPTLSLPSFSELEKAIAITGKGYNKPLIKSLQKFVNKFHRNIKALLTQTKKEPQWLLHTLCVKPTFRGRGLGSQLLAPVLTWADHGCVPVTCVVRSERNKDFFESRGFHVLKSGTSKSDDNPRFWLLRRPTSKDEPVARRRRNLH